MAVPSFGNLKSDAGLKKLNQHLVASSYITGYDFSVDDVNVFDQLAAPPQQSKYPAVHRWYMLVASYPVTCRKRVECAAAHATGEAKPAAEPKAAAPAAPKADDDDLDLFADDDDAEAEMKAKMVAKKEEAAKKKKEKKPVVAKSSVTFEAMPYGENDISEMYESHIKKITIDGLVWGPSAKVMKGPFGIKMLNFGCAIEDEKVGQEDIEEAIETINMSEENKKQYIELRRNGDLDDYDEEWPGKLIGNVRVISFQKI